MPTYSAGNRGWADDVLVFDHAAAGLPAPSLIRCAKIATIDVRHAERLGRASATDIAAVQAAISRRLAG